MENELNLEYKKQGFYELEAIKNNRPYFENTVTANNFEEAAEKLLNQLKSFNSEIVIPEKIRVIKGQTLHIYRVVDGSLKVTWIDRGFLRFENM